MFKLGVEGDQLIPDADKAGFLSQLRSLPQKARADGAERQDGGTAPIPAFQVLDDRLAVRFLPHHDVLHSHPQGCFDGYGVWVRNL